MTIATNATVRLQHRGDPIVVDIVDPPTPVDTLPVLLLHGWGGTGRYWRSLTDRLGGRYRFIVPDLPGVGRSLPVRRARTMFDQAAAVEAILDQLDLPRVHIVGHSMGSGIAVLFSAARPDRVERLILTSLAFYRDERERIAFMGVTMLLDLQLRLRGRWMAGYPSIVRQAARQYFHRIPDDAALLRAGFLDFLSMDHGTGVASARSAASPKIPAAGRAIQAPTLLIACRHDQVMPVANVTQTANTIPNCTVRMIDDSGHLPMIEQPDEYAAIVGDFLAADTHLEA